MNKRKQLYLLSFFAIAFISCNSLKKVSLNKDLSIKIPIDARQIQANQIADNITNYKKGLLFGGKYFAQMNKLYVVDDVLIGVRVQVWTTENSSNKTTLEAMKTELASSFTNGGFKITESFIKTVGSNRFLIFSYQKDRTAYFSIFSDFGKNTNNIDGFIRYEVSNQKKADKILYALLKNFKTK